MDQGNRNGQTMGLGHFPRRSTVDGSISAIAADGNSWFSCNGAFPHLGLENTGTTAAAFVETNPVTLTVPPALNFADPGTATPAAAPGFFNFLFYYGDNIANMFGVQMRSDVLDIRFAASAAAGAPLTTLRPYGAPFYANDSPTSPLINPFGTAGGNTWAIVRDSEYFPSSGQWAPDGMFTILPSADTLTAQIRVGAGVTPGTRLVKVRCTNAGGLKVDWRFYLVAL